jgi:hypothetical protein
MMLRLAIAALLAVAAASGCSSLEENTISLVAQKPMLSRWPLKRTAPAARADRSPAPAAGKKTESTSSAGNERFLETLSPELRDRIESELEGATLEERQRLLSYLATVDAARIPTLLDARHAPRAEASPEMPQVVTAAAEGTPTFELAADEVPDRQVEPAAAQTAAKNADLFQTAEAPQAVPAETVSAPIARPRRNPLIEIQGVEFEDSAPPVEQKVTPASDLLLDQQSEPEPSPETPGSPGAPPSINPLARLKEWTTIRKPDPSPMASQPPVQVAHAPTDPLSLQGLSRRLRGGPKVETASLPLDELPPAAGESPHLHEGLQRLIALMEAETARLKPGTSFSQREEYVRRHAELRMLLLMSRQPTLALQAIPDVEPETQEFWTSLMWSMSNYFDSESIVDPAERAAAALDRLRAAEQHLQSTARLELRSLAFCDKIDGFGSYHPFEQDVFRPGQPILLYAEVRNFKTDVTSAGRYRTSLKSTIEIMRSGSDGEIIERRHFDSTEDQSRSPRMDYFHSYKLDLPLHLTPGTYSLKLTLEDELSGKIGASSIEFLVR